MELFRASKRAENTFFGLFRVDLPGEHLFGENWRNFFIFEFLRFLKVLAHEKLARRENRFGLKFAKNAPFELKIFSGFGIGLSRPHVNFEPIRFMSENRSFEKPPKKGVFHGEKGYLAKSASEGPGPVVTFLEKFFEDFGDWPKTVFPGQSTLNSTMTALKARFERG